MTASWAESGCFPVADGVHRIPLQMPQDGLRAINVYVLETDVGLALIDGGWRRESTHEELDTALSHIGRRPSEIHDIYVTHVHRDHYTFAVELRRRYGSRVHLGRAEQPGIDAIAELNSNVPESSILQLRRAGAPDIGAAAYSAAMAEPFEPSDWDAPDAWLTDGPVTVPGRNLVATHTPGHTKGHMVFHDGDLGISFTGDHVLPTITPSIGFELGEWDLPLARYLSSLTLMLDDADRSMMPSHGDPGGSVHGRCRELLAHHDNRLAHTLDAVAALGPCSGRDVASALTWTRRERPFTDLDDFNKMVATCETLAHLDVLAHRGTITVRTDDEVDIFSGR
jgi:glyoxylase-like metal-dependent hydrolase (beta-lactamase superfamily II)